MDIYRCIVFDWIRSCEVLKCQEQNVINAFSYVSALASKGAFSSRHPTHTDGFPQEIYAKVLNK